MAKGRQPERSARAQLSPSWPVDYEWVLVADLAHQCAVECVGRHQSDRSEQPGNLWSLMSLSLALNLHHATYPSTGLESCQLQALVWQHPVNRHATTT